jgi:hypothetical protein
MPQIGSIAPIQTDRSSSGQLPCADPGTGPRANVNAVDYIRRMRGGSQSRLVRCSDGVRYVVKLQNNPQGGRILANELLGTLLARKLVLPTPAPAVVNVSEEFIQNNSEMVFASVRGQRRMKSGLCFGSRYLILGTPKTLLEPALESGTDYLRANRAEEMGNIADIAGFLVFDKWTCNTDGRQTLVVKRYSRNRLKIVMIDQGHCFNGAAWAFPDAPLYGVALYNSVFERIPSFSSFELWLDRLEHLIDRFVLESTAARIPPEWYENDRDSLRQLLDRLEFRRKHVADLVWSAWRNARKDFPFLEIRRKRIARVSRVDARQLRFADFDRS